MIKLTDVPDISNQVRQVSRAVEAYFNPVNRQAILRVKTALEPTSQNSKYVSS